MAQYFVAVDHDDQDHLFWVNDDEDRPAHEVAVHYFGIHFPRMIRPPTRRDLGRETSDLVEDTRAYRPTIEDRTYPNNLPPMPDTATPDYCDRHDVNIKQLTGYDRCPLCEEDARIQAEAEHQATRDRTMEPW